MFKLKAVFICFCLIFTVSSTACSPNRPVLPSDVIKNTRMKLGYALGPEYLPQGFKYDPGAAGILPPFIGNSIIQQVYKKDIPGGEPVYLAMIYPLNTDVSTSFEELMGLRVPEDAVYQAEINGMTAYMSHGGWSDETLRRISRLEEPIIPEWDYGSGNSIRFAVAVPGSDIVWVLLKPVMLTDKVSDEDLIRIAGSVVAIN